MVARALASQSAALASSPRFIARNARPYSAPACCCRLCSFSWLSNAAWASVLPWALSSCSTRARARTRWNSSPSMRCRYGVSRIRARMSEMRSSVSGWLISHGGVRSEYTLVAACMRWKNETIPEVSYPPAPMIWKPTRSASRSASRVKLSWRWICKPCPPMNTPIAASGPAFEASAARMMAASGIRASCFCWPIMRAIWRWVTWPISCDSTEASSDSVWAAISKRRVHGDEAARQREGVEHRVAHREEIEVGAGLAARAGIVGDQAAAEIVQVFEDRIVVEEVAVAPDVAHDLLAQLALEHWRQVFARGVAEGGQAVVVRLELLRRSGRRRERHRRERGHAHGREQAPQPGCGAPDERIGFRFHGAIILATIAATPHGHRLKQIITFYRHR